LGDLGALVFLIVIGTSIWVWIDARSKAKNTADGRISGNRPYVWFLGSLFIWIIGFPLYLVKRGQTRGQLQNNSPDSQPKLQASALERERFISQREAERAECLARAAALEERYKVTKDESLVPRIQTLRAAATALTAAADTLPQANPTSELQEQERVRKEIQGKWESRTPEDLLEEARALTQQFKVTHDDSLVPRIQALRRTADERRRVARNAPEKQPQSGPSAFCVKCGRQLPADSQYCSHCGVNEISLAQIRPAKRPASFKKVMLYSVLAFVGLSILVAIYSNIDRIAPTPPPPASPADKWRVTEGRSPMDDSKEVVLKLDAQDQIEGPLGPVRPSLIVRCKEKKTDVYVVTGMAADIETDFEGGPKSSHTVRVRLDSNPPMTLGWYESTDNKALFAEDMVWDEQTKSWDNRAVIEFAEKLAGANTMTFEFTPFNGNPQIATFVVQGLRVHLPKVAEACGWIYE
jgi:predicted nucleic acid-binding Zn ribbon protein